MKNTIKVLMMSSLLSITAATAAVTAPDSIYTSGSMGKNIVKKVSTPELILVGKLPTVFRFEEHAPMSLTFKPGLNLKAAMGGQWAQYRLEGELSYTSNRYKSITQNDTPFFIGSDFEGKTTAAQMMVNGLVDVPLHEQLTPYMGLGIGVVHVRNQLTQKGVYNFAAGVHAAATDIKVSMNETRFAYQGVIGAKLNLNQHISLLADYKHVRTGKFKAFNSSIKGHVLSIGLSYKF